MIFLIEYDRVKGETVSLKEFADERRHAAEDERLQLELTLRDQELDREVVLLEAASREALLLTHRRYFGSLSDLVRESGNGLRSTA